jgi:hypothetical protein
MGSYDDSGLIPGDAGDQLEILVRQGVVGIVCGKTVHVGASCERVRKRGVAAANGEGWP